MRRALVLVLAASAAHADTPKQRADAVFHEGEQLYAAKQYLAAAAKFEASYALDADPGVLFTIAQAYRLGRACAQAARFYHRFVEAVPNPPERDKLDRYVAEMDACAKAEAGASQPTVIHDTQVVHDTRVVREGRSPVLAIAVAGAGIVALGVGAYFTHDVHQIQQDRDAVCIAGCDWGASLPRLQHLDDRGHRAELGEAIAYGVGGAAVIAGVALYLAGRSSRVEPVVSPVAGGATVGLRWQ